MTKQIEKYTNSLEELITGYKRKEIIDEKLKEVKEQVIQILEEYISVVKNYWCERHITHYISNGISIFQLLLFLPENELLDEELDSFILSLHAMKFITDWLLIWDEQFFIIDWLHYNKKYFEEFLKDQVKRDLDSFVKEDYKIFLLRKSLDLVLYGNVREKDYFELLKKTNNQ